MPNFGGSGTDSSPNKVAGNVADNAADADNPVKVGGRYNLAAPTYDDGDRADLQVDVNGNLKTTSQSSVADNAPDTENPLKVGGRYNLALPTYADGDKADLQVDANGQLRTTSSLSSAVADNDPDTENPIKVGSRYNAAAPTYADGDKADLQADVNGRLLVSGTFSSSVADNAPDTENPIKMGSRYNAAAPTYADGDKADLQSDVNGRLLTSGTISSSVADNAPDTENPLKVGSRYNLAAQTYADGDKADLQSNVNGHVIVDPRQATHDNLNANANMQVANADVAVGNPVPVSGTVAHDAADSGNPVKAGGVYNNAAPTLDDGDRGDLQLDAAGRLQANAIISSSVADNAADTENPIKVGSRYNLAAQTYGDGDKADLQSNVNGHLLTEPRQATHDNLNANANIQIGNADAAVGNPVPVAGTIADNAADSGNPVKAGSVYNLAAPTYGDGDRADLQGDVNGNLKVSIEVDNAGIGGGGGGSVSGSLAGTQSRYMNQLKAACAAGTATATDFTWNSSIAGDQTYFYRDITVTSNSATLSSGETVIFFCRNFTINASITLDMNLQRTNTTVSGRHYSYGTSPTRGSYASEVLQESITEAADEIVMWDVHHYLTDPYSVFRGQMDTTGVDTAQFDTFVPGSVAWDYQDRQNAFDNTTDNYFQRVVKLTSWPGPGSRNASNNESGGSIIIFCENDFTNNGTLQAEATGASGTGGGGSVCVTAFNDIDEGTIQIGGQSGYGGWWCALYGNALTTGTIGHSGTASPTGGNGKVTRQKFYEGILNGL